AYGHLFAKCSCINCGLPFAPLESYLSGYLSAPLLKCVQTMSGDLPAFLEFGK
ncbi:7153_t:CDS:1, partial [Entrophospora sp. SA101]